MFEQAFKNIEDVLWKEAGCSSELDYTEQTSWMLFLKYLDDLEQEPLGLGKPIIPEQAKMLKELYKLKVATYKSSTSPLEKEERGIQQDAGETTNASSSRKKSKKGRYAK